MNTMVTSLLRVRRDGLKHEQKDVLFCEKDTGFASCVCPAMLQDTCGCRCTSTSDGVDNEEDQNNRVFLLLPTDPLSNASTVANVRDVLQILLYHSLISLHTQDYESRLYYSPISSNVTKTLHQRSNTGTYGCEPTMPHLWNVVVVALQCAIVWIMFRIFEHNFRQSVTFLLVLVSAHGISGSGMSPDDEYLNCLVGEGSAWDLIASYAYCAFYVWVIIVYRDDLTPVYRLWYVFFVFREGCVLQPHQHIKHRYDYIFHPNIELPTPTEKRKGVHRGDKCRSSTLCLLISMPPL